MNAGYGVLYEHIGTVYQSVHTHFLIVGIKIPTHKDIPQMPINATKQCHIDHIMSQLPIWKVEVKNQCKFLNGLSTLVNKQATYWYNRVFHIIHSDIAALIPNQEIKFLTDANLKHEEESKEESSKQRKKRSIHLSLSMVEQHHQETYRLKYLKMLPSDYDSLYGPFTNEPHDRSKRFLSSLIKGLGVASRGANIFGRLVSGIKKIGGFIFKGINGLFSHHKTAAIHRAVKVLSGNMQVS